MNFETIEQITTGKNIDECRKKLTMRKDNYAYFITSVVYLSGVCENDNFW